MRFQILELFQQTTVEISRLFLCICDSVIPLVCVHMRPSRVASEMAVLFSFHKHTKN